MINKLLSLKETGEIVSVFTNKNDTRTFSAGVIVGISTTHLLLAGISPYGINDGFLLHELTSIYRFEYGGIYQKKLQKLFTLNNQKAQKFDADSANLLDSLLLHAKSQCLIVTIELLDSEIHDIQGQVKDVYDDSVVFQTVSEYGCLENECMVKKVDITRIVCNSEEEIAIKMLQESLQE